MNARDEGRGAAGDRQAGALRSLSFALRVVRTYPPTSPILDRALDEAHEALRPFLEAGPLKLAVYPETLGWVEGEGQEREHDAPELAERLHGRGIGWLRLRPELDRDALRALLEVLARRRTDEALETDDAILAGELDGVEAERLRLEHLFDAGGEPLRMDPESLEGLVGWVLDTARHPPELASYSTADLLQLSVEQAATRWPGDSGLAQLAGTLSDLYERVDPEIWLEVLGETTRVPAAPEAARRGLDLGQALAAALSSSQVEELVIYGTSSRSRATPRLYALFDRLLRGRDDREAIAERVDARLARRGDPILAEAWPRFLQVLRGEVPEPFVDLDYRTTLESGIALGDAQASPAVRRRFGELQPEAVRGNLGHVTLSLLEREHDDEVHAALLETLERILPTLLRDGDLSLVEELVSTLHAQADDAARPAEQRAAAKRVLEAFRTPGSISVLLGRLEGRDTDFYPLWRIVEELGDVCLTELLDALESHATPKVRQQLVRILGKLPEMPVEELRRRLRDGQPSFTIHLMGALASLGRQDLAPLFRDGLEHDNPGVRRAAVQGLARLPASIAEANLIAALDDPVLDVRVAALRGFRSLLAADSEERLRAYLDLPNWHGRNSSRIRAAILAARHFAGPDTVGRLERLARKPLLFRRRRRAVWTAARRVLAELRDRDNLPYTSTSESSSDDADSVAA